MPICINCRTGEGRPGQFCPTGAAEGVIPPATQTVINTNEAQEVTADPAAASADNVGQVLIIKTGWTEGTNIATAVAGEVWMSNGSDWVKLG